MTPFQQWQLPIWVGRTFWAILHHFDGCRRDLQIIGRWTDRVFLSCSSRPNEGAVGASSSSELFIDHYLDANIPRGRWLPQNAQTHCVIHWSGPSLWLKVFFVSTVFGYYWIHLMYNRIDWITCVREKERKSQKDKPKVMCVTHCTTSS